MLTLLIHEESNQMIFGRWMLTHVPTFGRMGCVHVSVDTYSNVSFASSHTGEAVKDVKAHLLQAFSGMGTPSTIKTDNGPAYTSLALNKFFQDWNIQHVTAIPYNPQGQAIIERAHKMLKKILFLNKKGNIGLMPREILAQALFTLNFLDIRGFNDKPPIMHHFESQDSGLDTILLLILMITPLYFREMKRENGLRDTE